MTVVRHAAILLVEALAAAALLAAVVIWPPSREPARADAVVLLSGDGARLPKALALMERQVAPSLVFVGQPDTIEVMDICRVPQPFEVVCLRPDPDTTQTEAQATGRLATERRWRSIVVVTSRFHLVRARMLFRRCFDGVVDAVGDYPQYGREFAMNQIRHEWLGLVHATFLERDC